MRKSKQEDSKKNKMPVDTPSLTEGNTDQEPPIQPQRRSLFSQFFSKRTRHDRSLREELKEALNHDFAEDVSFSKQERLMLNNLLHLRDQRIDDIMVPRAEIEAMEIHTSLSEALHLFNQSGHSRMPVYEETLDDPRGMIHIRDILNYVIEQRGQDTAATTTLLNTHLQRTLVELQLIRPVLFVPSSMPAVKLMTRMQASRTQMALVIDEHGGTDGLVSLEDIVELIVGDIEDEHDDIDTYITQETETCWLVDARIELDELKHHMGTDFIIGEDGEEVDTLSGLIISLVDHIPQVGELINGIPHYQFEILAADSRRIQKVRIHKQEAESSNA